MSFDLPRGFSLLLRRGKTELTEPSGHTVKKFDAKTPLHEIRREAWRHWHETDMERREARSSE